MSEQLLSYIPEASFFRVQELLDHDHLTVKISKSRVTKHGDYRPLPDGKHQITINSNLNRYRFLITLVHEIAHYEAYMKFGRRIKPHGREWKLTFQRLMLPFLNPEVFPNELLPILAKHFKNPRASSDTDHKLALELKRFDPPNGLHYVHEVQVGDIFRLYNGREFRRGDKRVKRIECIEIKTGKLYLFNPNAEVQLIEN